MLPNLLAFTKILLIALWSIPLVIVQCIVLLFHKGPGAYYVPQLWHRGIACIIGLKVIVDGVAPTDRQVIFVSNHVSYLDIFAIGSVLRASFIAKEEIANWPVIGFLSKVQQTAFISRNSRQAKNVANSLNHMLAEGKSLILFPEGTSTDGKSVIPFKSSLFSLIFRPDGKALPIQPFALTLVSINGKAIENKPNSTDLFAWYGDMEFAPHFLDFLKNKGATVRLTFHPLIEPGVAPDRKALSQAAYETVTKSLSNNLGFDPVNPA